MPRSGVYGRWLLAGGGLALLLSGASGCLNFFSPIPPAPPELAGPCLSLPPMVRRHVYIFMMNGIDPLGVANLEGMREHVLALGFTQVYTGQLYHASWFEEEMQRIKKDDPDGRVVLIGYGTGAKILHDLGGKMAADGVTIDVLLALDPPADAAVGEGAFVVRVLGAPSAPETMGQVAAALSHCASQVRVVMPPLPPLPPQPEQGPMPRPLVPLKQQSFGPDWDSLKPVSRLN